MSNLGFVAFIVLIGCATGVIIEYLRKRGNKNDDADNAEMIQELERLEQRVQVLERIVTEKKFDLKKEIDKL